MWSNLALFAKVDPIAVAHAAGFVAGYILGLAIISLLGGLLLKLLTRWICKVKLPYSSAAGYVLLVSFISIDFGIIVKVLLNFLRIPTVNDLGSPTPLLSILTGILIILFYAFVWGCLITDKRGHPIGFIYGALVALSYSIIAFLIVFLLVFMIVIAIGLARLAETV